VKILALDTATENCSAALLIDGDMRSREIETERGHAERILPMIDDLLSEAQLTLSNLDAIAFGRGPGSFTGVRLAATVTQGLAFGANLGVVPISDLQAVAQRAFSGTAVATTIEPDPAGAASIAAATADPTTATNLSRILICNDARMSEVYWACFERADNGLARLEGEEHVSKPSDVTLPTSWTSLTTLGAGRGFKAYAPALQSAVHLVHLGPLTELLPRATEIALLSVPAVAAGHLQPPDAATPVYLRDNVAHVAQPAKPSR
jgi:tRNA threonylcarbamoyladenosine biosynthesis protein TsaB